MDEMWTSAQVKQRAKRPSSKQIEELNLRWILEDKGKHPVKLIFFVTQRRQYSGSEEYLNLAQQSVTLPSEQESINHFFSST